MKDIQESHTSVERVLKSLLCVFLTLDPTVARLQYSLALVLMLLGSIVRASE